MLKSKFAFASFAVILIAFLALCVTGASRGAQKKQLIHRIERAGGSVIFEDGLIRKRVEGIYLSQDQNADWLLNEVWRFRNLKSLTIQSSKFSDRSLRSLQGLQHLEKLDLSWTSVGDEGIRHLQSLPNLKSVVLNKLHSPSGTTFSSKSQLTDKATESLGKNRSLEKIIFWGADLSDSSLEHLSNCTRLKTLWLIDTNLTGSTLHHLQSLDSLEKVDLSDNMIAGEDLKPLLDMPQLKSLSVARTQVSPSEAMEFMTAHSQPFSIGY